MPAFLNRLPPSRLNRGDPTPTTERTRPVQVRLARIQYEVLPAIPVQNDGPPQLQRIRRCIVQDDEPTRSEIQQAPHVASSRAVPDAVAFGSGLPKSIVALLHEREKRDQCICV